MGLGIYKLFLGEADKTKTRNNAALYEESIAIKEDSKSNTDKSDTDKYILTVDASQKGIEISDMMYGLFLKTLTLQSMGEFTQNLLKIVLLNTQKNWLITVRFTDMFNTGIAL